MPFVTSRSNQIHYSVEGSGPLVILLHGLLSNAKSWKRWGVVDALADGYCVACVDSLGHGLSDKPSDESLYGLEARSRDVVAVIDDLGFENAHVLGYSMGGWLSVGVAKYHRHRLSSLIVGGWNILHGVTQAGSSPDGDASSFRDQIAAARVTAPAMVKWVTADVEPGLCACWDALADLRGARDAVVDAGVPVLLWSGRDDPSHEPMRTFAAAESLEFLSTPGDHAGAIWQHGAESGRGIRAFLDAHSN
ncbi:alpha/beta fold hydrolase [Phenylobacterium sp.]|jgi:pimeloyl-ACP methyl ester carboxylesterase|uniref:alpha/beta fold hydrolase n=1 Tax=Phenylobacterium sp. TaxID=1871053 RepID=UPI0037C758BB